MVSLLGPAIEDLLLPLMMAMMPVPSTAARMVALEREDSSLQPCGFAARPSFFIFSPQPATSSQA